MASVRSHSKLSCARWLFSVLLGDVADVFGINWVLKVDEMVVDVLMAYLNMNIRTAHFWASTE